MLCMNVLFVYDCVCPMKLCCFVFRSVFETIILFICLDGSREDKM